MALVSVTVPAAAANEKKDGKDLTRRLQQKISALEQENSQLVQEKSQLEGQLNHAKQSIELANRKGSSLDKALKVAESDKAELAEKLVKTEQKLAETAETLRLIQETKNQLDANLSTRNQELSACTTKNESLHRLGVELIKQYQEKSCLSSVLQKEPLTQLKSAEVENMVDEYREKLDQELVNQQLAGYQKPQQQKIEEQQAEQERAEREKIEQMKAEQEKAESLKSNQQNILDRMTHRAKQFFDDVEW